MTKESDRVEQKRQSEQHQLQDRQPEQHQLTLAMAAAMARHGQSQREVMIGRKDTTKAN